MRFVEIDIFGVYVAPIVPIMFVSWIATIGLRNLASHAGLLRRVWHPALFVLAIYILTLSAAVLLVAHGGFDVRF